MNARILTAMVALAMAKGTETWATTNAWEQASLVEHHVQQESTVEQQSPGREDLAPGLHPIVQTMAMLAPAATEECAMALMSFDRKLKSQLAGSSATGARKRDDVKRRESAAAKAEKWASAVCGLPYGPCVDARIERKLLDGGGIAALLKADRKIEKQCAKAS